MALVAYTDPQGVFGKHEGIVLQHLKRLRNLHWRPLSPLAGDIDPNAKPAGAGGIAAQTPVLDTTIRTIAELDLRLAPETGDRPRQHQIPGLNTPPLVQILVIETSPVEIYREKLRQIGKEWLSRQVNVRDATGYVVVHAVSPQDSPKLAKAIWTRLTNEFSATNCVQVTVADPSAHAGWSSLQHLVAEQLLTAFGLRIQTLQAEIRKLRATQDMPGWNFGTFFAVHESLASAYASLSLVDDAFRVYQYLEAVVAAKPREIWAPEPRLVDASTGLGDDSYPTNTRQRNALVDLVLSQKGSYFDVQHSLLTKQVDLLMRMAGNQSPHSDSLADSYVLESVKLVTARLPLLQDLLNRSLGKAKALVWLLLAIRRFFARVAEIGSPRIASGKGDLVLIERDYLQGLAAVRGWHIPGVFNDISLQDDPASPEEAEKQELDKISGLESENEFQAAFFRLTNTALEYYGNAGLHRAVMRLISQQLLIRFHGHQFEECWAIYEKHPQILSGQLTPSTTVFEAVLACARELKLHDKTLELSWKVLDLPHPPLKLVQCAVAEIEKSPGSGPASHVAAPTKKPLKNWFVPHLVPYLRADDRGYYLELRLVPKRPRFPFLKFSTVTITAGSTDAVLGSKSEVCFETSDDPESVDEAGSRLYKLYTPRFIEGVLEIRRLDLVYRESTEFEHTFDAVSVAMRPLASSFNAQITLAKYHSMRKRNIELKLRSPLAVKHAKVSLQPVDPQLQLLMDKVTGADPSSLTNFTSATITIPVLVDFDYPVLRLKVVVDYDTGDRTSKYEFYEQLNFALAVSVDFQESFRQPPRILTQFLVKPFNQVPTVFLAADLQESSSYSVEKLDSPHYRREMVAYNNAPISYVFSISKTTEPSTNKSRSLNRAMQFSLQYRSILWECQHILYENCVMKLDGLNCYAPTLSHILEQIGPHIDLAEYVCSHSIRFGDPVAVRAVVHDAFQYMDPKHGDALADIIIGAAADTTTPDARRHWDFSSLNSTMVLDVPDPDAEVVHYLSLQVDDNRAGVVGKDRSNQYAVGEAISATITIESITFRSPESLASHEFQYEFDRLSDGWSYTGRVKGQFRGGTKVCEQLSLVPNRSGELFLPNIIVKEVNPQEEIPINELHIGDRRGSAFSDSIAETEVTSDQVVVSEHANTRLLIVPDVNMLAITF